MIKIPGAVKNHLLDSYALGLFSYGGTNGRGLLGLFAGRVDTPLQARNSGNGFVLKIVNELRIRPTDNSLSAPLNWIYAPGDPHQALQYQLLYPSLRLGSKALPALEKGQPLFKDYLVGTFQGSTDRAITLYYNPGKCLRLLSPMEAADPSLPEEVRQAAALSNLALVQPAPRPQADLIPGILPAAAPGDWCQTYEQAALAVQNGAWQQAADLGDAAGDLAQKIFVYVPAASVSSSTPNVVPLNTSLFGSGVPRSL